MMENRSFDHFLGWLDDADGRQAGLPIRRPGGDHAPHASPGPGFQGCDHPDPDHSFQGGRIELNGGACDGWLRAGDNDDYAIGYYTKKDLAFLGNAAPRWATCDRYFAAIMAETFPNRIYQHAAQTDRLTNTTTPSLLPTIWDQLAGAGLDGRYYFSDVPVLAQWGPKYVSIGRPIADFFADASAGTLPNVAFVDPSFIGEDVGTSNDDHPHADIRNGEVFLNAIYRAVTMSPAWPRTVLVFNFDEWGGFTDGLLGFRVPCLLVSPFAPRERVSHVVFDHTSILRMIAWRWNLPAPHRARRHREQPCDRSRFPGPLAPRQAVRRAAGPFGTPCSPATLAVTLDHWQSLRGVASASCWPA